MIDPLLQALPYVPLVLGIYISFHILKITDLTADGSFVLGGGLFAKLWVSGLPYGVALLGGLTAGASVGFFLAFLQKDSRMPPLLASIVCVFMLYSVNLLFMGQPNITLLFKPTPFDQTLTPLMLSTVILIVTLVLLILYTRSGLVARALGTNPTLLQQRGYCATLVRGLGLGASNALYALSGILCVHVQKFADINMGLGLALMGIGAVMIGRQFFMRCHLLRPDIFQGARDITACIFGICVYFTLMHVLLMGGINPLFLKLALGGTLITTFLSTYTRRT